MPLASVFIEPGILAIITGLGAVVSAVCGVLLAIRAARSKERQGAKEEIDQLTEMLSEERDKRVKSELHAHKMRLLLAENGIEVPDESHKPGSEGLP